MSETTPFPFEEGDDVLVRVREHGTSGKIVARFMGTCDIIHDHDGQVKSPMARIRLSWGLNNSVTLRPYEADFEVLD